MVGVGKRTMPCTNSSDTSQPVQAQRMTTSLKFWIEEEVGLYYPSQTDDFLQSDLSRALYFSARVF